MDVAVVNGLFVRMAGPQGAAPLILIHAFADSGQTFTPLFGTPLADRHRLIAVDLAGFGASPRDPNVSTMNDHAETIVKLARSLSLTPPIGLVAHSVASMIAVDAVPGLGSDFSGLFSIEGNLVAADAYFSGRAASYGDPQAFKRSYLDDIWLLAHTKAIFRRYFAAVVQADAVAMWELGRDAHRRSVNDAPGRAYRRISPALYYWSSDSTSTETGQWIAGSGITHRLYAMASHWPMVEQPEATAAAIASFFDRGVGAAF